MTEGEVVRELWLFNPGKEPVTVARTDSWEPVQINFGYGLVVLPGGYFQRRTKWDEGEETAEYGYPDGGVIDKIVL